MLVAVPGEGDPGGNTWTPVHLIDIESVRPGQYEIVRYSEARDMGLDAPPSFRSLRVIGPRRFRVWLGLTDDWYWLEDGGAITGFQYPE